MEGRQRRSFAAGDKPQAVAIVASQSRGPLIGSVARSQEPRGRSKRTMMNRLAAMLSLVLLVTLPETSVAAATNLHATRKAAEPYQISPGPTGTCSIYIQGRYSECEFTTEHGCQKLSEVRNRPPKIALRRWYALPQEGWGWDQPRCAGKVPKSSLY
jgi:hypothetical protein